MGGFPRYCRRCNISFGGGPRSTCPGCGQINVPLDLDGEGRRAKASVVTRSGGLLDVQGRPVPLTEEGRKQCERDFGYQFESDHHEKWYEKEGASREQIRKREQKDA